MKDKLEPNMYVRTKWGIAKYIHNLVTKETVYRVIDKKIIYENVEDWEDCLLDNEILKASHNIIDLIEEKDLLEIEYFSLRYEKRVTRLFEVTYKEGRFINLDNAKCQFMLIDNDWTDNDKELEPIIKSIVTKEQFSNMEYRLGDDK